MNTEPTFHWIPLTPDMAYHREVCRQAADTNVQAIHLSRDIGCSVSAILADPRKARFARELLTLYAEAGLDVWCDAAEVEDPADAYTRDGKLRADEDGFYRDIDARYDAFLENTLPGLTGIVLSLTDTACPLFDDTAVLSTQPAADRVQRLVEAVASACRRQGVALAVRSFLSRKRDVGRQRDLLAQLPDDVIVLSMCVPHDWHLFYPPNPLIGTVGEREQWVEHDLGLTQAGEHLYPYADLDQLHERMRHEHRHGVRTWCVRLDRHAADAGQCALTTPWGRVVLDAMPAMARNPDDDIEPIWDAWEQRHFVGARTVVDIATQVVQHMLFSLGTMTHAHSRLPTYAYARSHITVVDPRERPEAPATASDRALALAIDRAAPAWTACDRLAGWTDDGEDWAIEEAMETMSRQCLEECIREADDMRLLAVQARACIEAIEDGGPEAETWERGVEQLVVWAYCFAAWKMAYFGVRHCQEHPSAEGLRRCEQLIDAFEHTCAEAAPALANTRLEATPVLDEDGMLAGDVVASLREALECCRPSITE